ncbi:hypothetical protein Tco_0890982 [Tanacetum coccineum]|uniref:CCHC-type domain-containing protein n=1 Tax=Tanacetum coccineum TaxID=301880 RepID=A0ABQ5C1L1_9ASTR
MASFNQRHCFHCKDPLEEHERCQRCTCKRCWSGLSKGFCHICNEYSSIDDSNPNSFIDSPKVFNPPPQPLTHSIESLNANPNFDNTPQEQSSHYQDPSENFAQNFSQCPPQINQNFCYGCGDSLDDFFCQRCTCEFCGNGAHYGYDCPPQVPFKKLQQLEQVANLSTYTLRHFNSFCYDDDDDVEYTIAITPEKPVDSLIMEDQHLDTISKTESDEFIKSSVENLVPTPSDPLFDDSTSSDDESSHEEVRDVMSFKTYSNPLFDLDEEIISSEFNPIYYEDLDSTPKDVRFDVESYLLESLVNRDTLNASPPKIDFLFDEFAGELTRLQLIPPGIDNINLDSEGDILFLESLLYDNSSPRPPEAFQDNSNTIIESLPTSPIPVEDSDSLREEIDIFFSPDDSIPPGIESDDFDSKDDYNSTSLPEFDSFHVDYPDLGDSTINVVEDIPVDVPNILPTHPALLMDFDFIPSHNDLGSDPDVSSPFGDRNKIYDLGICIEVESMRFLAPLSPVIDTLLPFSSENEDKVFNHGVLAYKEKSPPSSSHRGLKAFQLSPESPMMIHGDNTPNLGVRHPHFYPP